MILTIFNGILKQKLGNKNSTCLIVVKLVNFRNCKQIYYYISFNFNEILHRYEKMLDFLYFMSNNLTYSLLKTFESFNTAIIYFIFK